MSFNVIKNVLVSYVYLSIVKGIFHNNLNIAEVAPIYKADSSSNVSNYRPIALPCFSKMLGCIVYNPLQIYLNEPNMYDKEFGFQTSHSTDHVISELVDQIYEVFEKNKYTLDVFY